MTREMISRTGAPARSDAGYRSVVTRPFLDDRRGSVALIVGLAAPVLLMCVGLGIEASNWNAVKVDLQRTADMAAMAGALEYLQSSNAQQALYAAADMAENNGIKGGASRSWNAATSTVQDGSVTALLADAKNNTQSGVKAVGVTVTATVPAYITGAVLPLLTAARTQVSNVTISATGWAEPKAAAQPCLYALDAKGQGVNAGGNASATLTGCTVKSNANISATGSTSLKASGFYAAGTASGNLTGQPQVSNNAAAADPYKGAPAITKAVNTLNAINPKSLPPFNDSNGGSKDLPPDKYPDMNIQGTINMTGGTYYIAGNLTLNDGASLIGTNVTLVVLGTVNMKGRSTISLSAAKPLDVAAMNLKVVPGVAFIGVSSQNSGFGGGTTSATLNGVVYYPYGNLSFGGTSSDKSAGCTQVVAGSITLQGNPGLSAVCDTYYDETNGARRLPTDKSQVGVVQ